MAVFSPNRNISLWGGTALCDKRLEFNLNSINVNHEPNDDYFKIGLWCNKGEAKCISNNQVLRSTLIFSKIINIRITM